jgi:hypothetical protein
MYTDLANDLEPYLEGTDAAAIHDNVAGEIAAITSKASPVAADLLLIEDSAALNAKRRATVGSLPVAQAQVAGVLLTPAADAALAILNTTRAAVLTVSGAGTVVISTSSSYAGQVLDLFATSVSGGGKYTLAVSGGDLTFNATNEGATVIRNAANNAWIVINLSGATIV